MLFILFCHKVYSDWPSHLLFFVIKFSFFSMHSIIEIMTKQEFRDAAPYENRISLWIKILTLILSHIKQKCNRPFWKHLSKIYGKFILMKIKWLIRVEIIVFSSPEHVMLKVSYCDHPMSSIFSVCIMWCNEWHYPSVISLTLSHRQHWNQLAQNMEKILCSCLT